MTDKLSLTLDGATRVHYIVGDPIAQVKSPSGVSQALQALGHHAIVVPAHVSPAHLSEWVQGVSRAQNVDGIIVTVPHKFACFDLCRAHSERAAFLNTVNVMRRQADGTWYGDMFDGLGFVSAMRGKGYEPMGKKTLLVGAGGAGSAIAHALVLAGVSELAIHDEDDVRRTTLIGRLSSLGKCTVRAGSAHPTGFDVVINATPMGMKESDPLPLQANELTPSMLVGCVITQPTIPALIAQAQGLGCPTLIGTEMFAQVRDLMVEFLLGR